MTYSRPSWDEWLAAQDQETRARALELAETFRKVGCSSPEDWVRSEIDEDFAQLGRFVFLRLLWDELLQPWREAAAFDDFPAASRLVEAGADPEMVRELCGAVASNAVWRMLTLIDNAWTHPLADDLALPGWMLMEVDVKTDKLTGRELAGIHESVSDVDPEEREGHPFF